MIVDGGVRARIDAHGGVLYAQHTDVRSTTFAQALELARMFVRDGKVRHRAHTRLCGCVGVGC